MVSASLSKKSLLFVGLFAIAVLIADQIRFSAVWGAPNQYFTLFQFVGPLPGAFLGLAGGIASVFVAQVISFVALGKEPSLLNLLRLLPMLFATIYFANSFAKERKNYDLLVPLACMALFIAHPVGAGAWFYSLYWLIPVAARLAFPKNLFAKSLGASFTAHAVGSIVFLYFVPTQASMWIALIPVVAFERLAFALGISVSYVAFNVVLDRLDAWNPRLELTRFVSVNPEYVLRRR